MAEETPRENRRSGEWSEMDELRGTCHRIEKKLDAAIAARGEDQVQAVRIEERLKNVEKWRDEVQTDARQMNVGTKLAAVGSGCSLLVSASLIVFEIIRAH